MLATYVTPDVLVALAGLTYVVGYLVINQIVLRLLILAGTFLYIAYYAVAADTPLWGAIYISVAIALSNMFGLTLLLMQRLRRIIPVEFRALYEDFGNLQPGDFRHVVKLAERVTVTEDTVLTVEGEDVDHVYLILSGKLFIQKRGEAFEMPAGVFVGEVAYLLRTTASASTRLAAGGEVLAWPIATLRRKSTRSPRFKLALEAMISRDLARKVSLAVAPADRRMPMALDQS